MRAAALQPVGTASSTSPTPSKYSSASATAEEISAIGQVAFGMRGCLKPRQARPKEQCSIVRALGRTEHVIEDRARYGILLGPKEGHTVAQLQVQSTRSVCELPLKTWRIPLSRVDLRSVDVLVRIPARLRASRDRSA